MSLLKQNQLDVQAFTSNLTEFATPLLFVAPTGETAQINGYCSDHSMIMDDMGNPLTGKRVTVSFSENLLTDLEYPTRNAKSQITFLDHRVTVTYVDGRTIKYAVMEWRPDYLVNLITLFLSVYNGVD